jgi:hypothetical protein
MVAGQFGIAAGHELLVICPEMVVVVARGVLRVDREGLFVVVDALFGQSDAAVQVEFLEGYVVAADQVIEALQERPGHGLAGVVSPAVLDRVQATFGHPSTVEQGPGDGDRPTSPDSRVARKAAG